MKKSKLCVELTDEEKRKAVKISLSLPIEKQKRPVLGSVSEGIREALRVYKISK